MLTKRIAGLAVAVSFLVSAAMAQGPGGGGGPAPGPAPDPWIINGPTISYTQGAVVVGSPTGGGTHGAGSLNATSIYVNGVAVSTSAANLTVGTSTISSGTTTRVLYDNAGILGEYALTGTPGSVVMSVAPTITGHPTIEGVTSTGATGTGNFVFGTAPSVSSLTVTTAFTATGLVTNADLANSAITLGGTSVSLGGTTGVIGTQISALYLTSPVLTTPTLGVAVGTSLALGGATIGGNALAVTGTTLHSGNVSVSGASFGLTGNISAPAWLTGGVRYTNVAGTLTDTTSSGTVAAAYSSAFGGNTVAASSATVYTNYYGAYFTAPVAGSNVTFTHSYALGADTINATTLYQGGTAIASTFAPLASPTFTGTVTMPDASTFGTNFAVAGNTILTAPSAAKLQLGAANAASPVAQTLQVQGARAGTDTNVSGANFTIASGMGTGNAAPSSLIFQLPVATSGGTGAQTLTTSLTLNASGASGNLLVASGGVAGFNNTIEVHNTSNGTETNFSVFLMRPASGGIGQFLMSGPNNNYETTTYGKSQLTFESNGAGGMAFIVSNATTGNNIINFFNNPGGGGTPTKIFSILNTGQLVAPAYYTTAGLLQNDTSGNVTTNNGGAAASVSAAFIADHRITLVQNGVTYYLAASTTAW